MGPYWDIPFFIRNPPPPPAMEGMTLTGRYLLKCDSYRSLILSHSMEGRILTGPYHANCETYRSQLSQFPWVL